MTIVLNGDTGITSPGGDTQAADTTINGVRVGRGAGAVATNTAVGASALAGSNTGDGITAVGQQALLTNTTGFQNSAVGKEALKANTTGFYNNAVGAFALGGNTTGNYNNAFGRIALYSNTTGSYNTAVGHEAGYANTTGLYETFVGAYAGAGNTTGEANSALGVQALEANTTGGFNTAIGRFALKANTTASNNTAVGYQAGYLNATGASNIFVGFQSGLNTTSSNNTFVGYGAGYLVNTGAKNTIIGAYGGNQGGLDIRSASNYIVLSDGDGNPRGYCEPAGTWRFKSTSADGVFVQVNGANQALNLSQSATSLDVILRMVNNNVSQFWDIRSIGSSATPAFAIFTASSTGVQLSYGATSWSTYSDERLKDITGTYQNALDDISKIKPIKFTWKSDADKKPCVGVSAQSVQAVVPEAVEAVKKSGADETEYLSVRYTELIPLMIAAIQELKAEFDAYKEAHP